MDPYAFDQSRGLTAEWVDDAVVEAKVVGEGSDYYRGQNRHDEWPDCEGYCFYGRCAIFAVERGCCWAGPPRGINNPFERKLAGKYDAGGDGVGAGDVTASTANVGVNTHSGFYGNWHHWEKPWLCWS